MKNTRNIMNIKTNTKFVICYLLFVICTCGAANADIASKEYVDALDTAQGTVITNIEGDITTINTKLNSVATTEGLAELTTRVGTAETDIDVLQADKADKATTLAGYGITDAPTLTQINSVLVSFGDEVDGKLSAKAQANNVYTKTESDGKYATTAQGTKADTTDATLTSNDTINKANSALQSASLTGLATTAEVATAITADNVRDDGAYDVVGAAATALADAKTYADMNDTDTIYDDTALSGRVLSVETTVGNTALTTTKKNVTEAVNELNTAITNINVSGDIDAAIATDNTRDDATYATAVQGTKADATDNTLTTNNTVAKANAAIPAPQTACSAPSTKCLLATNSTGYYWEEIVMPQP